MSQTAVVIVMRIVRVSELEPLVFLIILQQTSIIHIIPVRINVYYL